MTLRLDCALHERGRAAVACTTRMTSCRLLRARPCAIEGTDFIRTVVHGITHRTVERYSTLTQRYSTLTSERIVLTILIYTKSNHCMPYIACPSAVPHLDHMICGTPDRLLSVYQTQLCRTRAERRHGYLCGLIPMPERWHVLTSTKGFRSHLCLSSS